MTSSRIDDGLCWFHGKISREAAEELVRTGEEDGTFLIRESNTAAGDFVLSVLYKNEICHYQIRRHGEDAFFSIDDKVKILHGLDTLVEFYQQDANGLLTRLSNHLRKDPPPNHTRSHGVTNLLHRAIKENNETVVSELLKVGYRNVDAKNQDGQTALHLAAIFCTESILKLLLAAGVNVNCMDTAGNMPLHYACRKQSGSYIKALINANANVQGRNIKNGYVPLHEAARHGNLEAVKELLLANAPLLPRTSYGEFPIDLAKEASQTAVTNFLENYKTPPANTFELNWYHGTLSRDEAVEALMTYAENMEKNHAAIAEQQQQQDGLSQVPIDTSGCFLIRYSERKGSGQGYNVLTMLWCKQVKNFIISQSNNYLYIDDGPYLPSLEHLVEHFMRFSDGLPVPLKYAVKPKPKPPVPLFSTMPRKSLQNKSLDATSPTAINADSAKSESLHRRYSQDTPPSNAVASKPAALTSPTSGAIAKHSQTLTPKKKAKEHSSTSVFSTLKLKSPKKSQIIESLNINTLRKNKPKSKSISESSSKTQHNNNIEVEQLKNAEPLLKNLSFSTDFANLQLASPTAEEFYNVPKNNAAIGTLSPDIITSPSGAFIVPIEFEAELKTDAEVEYFTKSDIAIERERLTQQENRPQKFATNANGYVPTVDIRVFWDQSPGVNSSQLALEASAAELREFSHHPERLDSLISNASTESEMMRYINRQCSNISTNSAPNSSSAQLKLNYFIPCDCLEVGEVIGSGEFGSVHKGTLKRCNSESGAVLRCDVAIKMLRNEQCRSNKQEFLREASMMIRLQHHCIVSLIGISKGETLMMVQELVSLGSLLPFILNNRDEIKPNYELKLWASQIACGMEYLESQHFVHRDLAARNILLSTRNQAKISDFGLSRTLGTDNDCYQASQGGKWPIKWYAPESFNNGIFSHASDVWSFGVTLWEMFSLGDPPYGDIRGVDAIALIESGQRLPQPAQCPLHVYEIMKNCWNYKPKDRPTFHYLTDFFAKDPDYQNIMELVKTEHIS